MGKVLGDAKGQIRINIDIGVLSQGACPSGRLNQLAFDQAQLKLLQPLIVKGVKVKPEPASLDRL